MKNPNFRYSEILFYNGYLYWLQMTILLLYKRIFRLRIMFYRYKTYIRAIVRIENENNFYTHIFLVMITIISDNH